MSDADTDQTDPLRRRFSHVFTSPFDGMNIQLFRINRMGLGLTAEATAIASATR